MTSLRRAMLMAAGLAGLLVTGSLAGASAQPVSPDDEAAAPGELRVAADTGPHRVAGAYSRGPGFVEFTGEVTSPVTSSAHVLVNGKAFTLTRDVATGVATWGGRGQALLPDDRAVMRGFLQRLQHEWVRPARAEREPLEPHRDLVARLAMLLAEAPLGLAIEHQRVDRPPSRAEDTDGVPARTALGPEAGVAGATLSSEEIAHRCITDIAPAVAHRSGKSVMSSEVAAIAAAYCQVADDNGIWYFNCQTRHRTLCHDTRGHCWLCESIHSGPGSRDCVGECGPGCNGLNIYTYDCGDHDRCARVHGGAWNPWDADCGDEYWDADDDFIWGWPNCW